VSEAATLATLLERVPTERPSHEQSLVEPLRERVLALHARGVEGHKPSGSSWSRSTALPAATRRWNGACMRTVLIEAPVARGSGVNSPAVPRKHRGQQGQLSGRTRGVRTFRFAAF
jgi:hypothetical protein